MSINKPHPAIFLAGKLVTLHRLPFQGCFSLTLISAWAQSSALLCSISSSSSESVESAPGWYVLYPSAPAWNLCDRECEVPGEGGGAETQHGRLHVN